MKGHVIYDSAYGNSRAIAEAIATDPEALHTAAVSVADSEPGNLSAEDLPQRATGKCSQLGQEPGLGT
jgi:hypothetical protein